MSRRPRSAFRQFDAAAGDFLFRIVCIAFLCSGAICLSPYYKRNSCRIFRRIFCRGRAKPLLDARSNW